MITLDITWLAFLILAVYGTAMLITTEDGPLDIFIRFQNYLVARLGKAHQLTKLFSCPYCLAVWLTPVMLILFHYVPIVVIGFGIIGGAHFLMRRS